MLTVILRLTYPDKVNTFKIPPESVLRLTALSTSAKGFSLALQELGLTVDTDGISYREIEHYYPRRYEWQTF